MAVKNSLVQQKKQTLSAYLTQDAVKNRINQIIGGKDGQRFIASIVSAVSVNPALAECDHGTILSAALLGESLKLSPSPQLGQYYMVPFKKKDRNGNILAILAQFILGYKGYLQLAIRSGYYKKINVIPIKEGELNGFDPLNEVIDVFIIEDEEAREAAPTIGYYFMFEYLNGFRKAFYWSKNKMLLHADRYSPAFSKDAYEKLQGGLIPKKELWKYSSHWYVNFDDMAMKTMIRQGISKWGIMSVEMQQALERDDAVMHEDGTLEYVENAEDEALDVTPDETQGNEEEPPAKEPDASESVQDSFFDAEAGV